MPVDLINSILPGTIFAGVLVSVIAIVYAAFSKMKQSVQQALSLVDRVRKLDDQNSSDLTRLEKILNQRTENEGVFQREDVNRKIREILTSVESSSVEMIDIMMELGAAVPPALRSQVLPRTKEMERKIAATKTKVDELVSTINYP